MQSGFVPVGDGRLYYEVAGEGPPGSKKVLIRGADHIVNMSKPEEFNKTVLEFLNSQKIAITN